MATVASNLARIHDLEGTLSSVSVGGGAGASANTDIFIQNAQSLGRRQSNVTLGGFLVNDGATTDLSAAGVHLGAWVWVTHYAVLTDLRFRVSGAASGDYDEHIIPLTEYPSLGGWIRVWLDISRTPDATGGSALNEAAAQHYGPVVSLPSVGGNAANLILDAIDYTTDGLSLTGTSGVFQDFLTADEGTAVNKYGVVSSVSDIIYCRARLTLGTASSLAFSDSGFTLIFPQQNLVAENFMGITCDLQNAATDIAISSGTIASVGAKKGDFLVTGTSGALSLTGVSLLSLRAAQLTSACTITGGVIEGADLAHGGATITGATIRPQTASGVAMCDDFTPANVSNTTFIQAGSGHALEITSPGTYSFTSLFFSGFGADGTNDAAVYNNSGGAVTINIAGGGDTPTVRNGTGASTTINNAVTITLTNLVAGSRVYIRNETDGIDLFNVTEPTATFTDTVNFTGNKAITVRVRNASGGTKYKAFQTTGTLTSTGFSLTVNQEIDE